ncbi:translin-like [Clytia hemisphaerica]|uniref:Translin n=1 Tax=Clytia hemisphaerica TaxID=252671 RepID=A0A7M5TXR7_9CNID
MQSNGDLITMFSSFQQTLDEEKVKREDIKQTVQSIEQKLREMIAILQMIHHKADEENIKSICAKVSERFPEVLTDLKELADKIPIGQYYKYNQQWSFAMQRLVFVLTYVHYLTTEQLMSRELVAGKLNLKLRWEDGFYLDLDDYLIGVLQVASELSRLCTNAVIAGDYARPSRIGIFLSDLDAAFRLLNLKNDHLRKRFDALKYDLKKVEEIVYDLSVRGLKASSSTDKPASNDSKTSTDETADAEMQ